jgi:hypothetical protein
MSDTEQKKQRNNPGLTSQPPGQNPAAPYSPEEMPPNPRSGDASGDARDQKGMERRREAERERSETNKVKRSPQSN